MAWSWNAASRLLLCAAGVVGGSLALTAGQPDTVTGPSRANGSRAHAPDARAARVSQPRTPVPPPPLPAAVSAAIDHLPYEAADAADGGRRVDAGRYRATFTRQGMTFTPRAGDRAVAASAWRYRLVALEQGRHRETVRAVAPTVHPDRQHIVDYERPGLVERYVASASGVEQIFIIDRSALPARPAIAQPARARHAPGRRTPVRDGQTREDLVLVGDVSTALTPRREPTGGVAYARARARETAVTYGTPVAFDARGTRVPVTTRVDGRRLSLRLDGHALADATFPITIDPVIRGALWVDAIARRPDIAYNIRRNELLIVYLKPGINSSVRDLWHARLSMTGQVLGRQRFAVAQELVGPVVAYHDAVDEYMVTWGQKTPATDQYPQFKTQGRYARLDSVGALINKGPFLWLTSDEKRFGSLDLEASSDGPGDPTYAFVFEVKDDVNCCAGKGIHVLIISRHAASLPGSLLVPDATAASAAYNPHTDRYVVAMVDGSRIWIHAVLDHEEANLTPKLIVSSIYDVNPRTPAVACDRASRLCLVVWVDDRGLGSGHVYGQLITSEAAPKLVGDNFLILSAIGGLFGSYNSREPKVTAEPGGFIVVAERSSGVLSGSNDTNPVATYVTADGTVSSLGLGWVYDDNSSATPRDDGRPTIAVPSAYARTALAWEHRGNDANIYAAYILGRFSHIVPGKSGDIGGSAASDLLVFRPNNGTWYYQTSDAAGAIAWGQTGDLPILMDLNNDGYGDVGIWRPSTGLWSVRNSITGIGFPDVTLGQGGDIPVPGDYAGDGADDVAVYRPATGTWTIRDGATGATSSVQFGALGDIPVPADYDGNGKVDLGVYRPSDGVWYQVNLDGSNYATTQWGTAGDIPVQGNFTGDGRADRVIFRPSTGQWWILDGNGTGASSVISLGKAGDMPVPLDYDHDGLLNPAVYRLGTGETTPATWYILNTDSSVTTTSAVGRTGDLPMVR